MKEKLNKILAPWLGTDPWSYRITEDEHFFYIDCADGCLTTTPIKALIDGNIIFYIVDNKINVAKKEKP